MKPIYKPSGAAKEYGDYAINIYTGCPHRCFYCFAPSVLRRDREAFHTNVQPREGIVEAVKRQLDSEHITGQTIHLCFTCDPYPKGYDSTPTREIIKAIKDSGNHVQILTKNGEDAERDFDLLDGNDWFGITYAGYKGITTEVSECEPKAGSPYMRLKAAIHAKEKGINIWVSCEPVIWDKDILCLIRDNAIAQFDRIKIGKLNYHPSDIDWKRFGEEVERLCIEYGRNYYIKDSLRREMEKQ